MISCGFQILFWCIISVLATIIIFYSIVVIYFNITANSLINQFNQHLLQYCQTLPPITYRQEIYVPENRGIYELDLANALLDISFATSQSNCDNIILSNPPGIGKQMKLEGIDPISGKLLMFGYIFWSKCNKWAVFSFTGTFYISEWQSDIDYVQVAPTKLNNYQDGVLVHRGFYNIYLSIRDKIWNWFNDNPWVENIFITGHSLGGALSTLCAYDFATSNPIHYSFAAPRSGNSIYANIFNEILPTSIRVNNTEDIIPALPPSDFNGYNYCHTAQNVPFTVSLDSLSANHSMAYFEYLPVCPQVALCNGNE